MDVTLQEKVLERLSTVIDPETGVDVVHMRLVEDLAVDDAGVVSYTFRPSSPFCPLAVNLALEIKRSVAGVPGVTGQKINVEGYIDSQGLSELLDTV
ncbi:MAG: metal-sulfur cluster assembly factor [Alphaproteobacteria bacterium]